MDEAAAINEEHSPATPTVTVFDGGRLWLAVLVVLVAVAAVCAAAAFRAAAVERHRHPAPAEMQHPRR